MGASASNQNVDTFWDFEAFTDDSQSLAPPAPPPSRVYSDNPILPPPVAAPAPPPYPPDPCLPPDEEPEVYVAVADRACTACLPDKSSYKYDTTTQVASQGRHFVTTDIDPACFDWDRESEIKFHKLVASTIVGFLNSGEGGVISVGVSDTGFPVGLAVSPQGKHELRHLIQRCVDEIRPVVRPELCTVTFEPIYGVPFNIQPYPHTQREIRVMEITVMETMMSCQLYTWRGTPFLRRDGGTLVMTSAEIDWWSKLRRSSRVQVMRQELGKLLQQLQIIQKAVTDSADMVQGCRS